MSLPPSQSPPTYDHELRAASRNCGRNASGGCSRGYNYVCLLSWEMSLLDLTDEEFTSITVVMEMGRAFRIIMTGTRNPRMCFAVQSTTGDEG